MHHALLIDEILRLILQECTEWPKEEYRPTLCRIARCCKAWRGPALDHLWQRLDDVEPLMYLALLPQRWIKQVTPESHPHEIVNPAPFAEYAARVKQISHTSSIPARPVYQSMLVLPNVSRVSMKGSGCEVASSWTTSKALRHLDIVVDRAFNDRSQALHRRRETVASFLSGVQSTSAGLETLRFRGSLNDQLNATLRAFTTLRSLLLCTSNTLAPDTLAAIARFPHLERLELHVAHIAADEFRATLDCSGEPAFASLRDLEITSPPELLLALLEALPAGVLHALHVHTTVAPASFQSVFARLAELGAQSVRSLRFEYFPARHDQPASGAAPEHAVSLDTLRPLARLRALRVLDVAGGAPPSFRDEDIGALARWFPQLVELGLGLPEDCHPTTPFSRVTPAALRALARDCRSLASLVLPLDVCEDLAQGAPDFAPQAALRHLSMGAAPVSRAGVGALMAYVAAAFPAVEIVDSPAWGERTSLQRVTPGAAHKTALQAPFPEAIAVGQASYRFVSYSSD